MKRFLLLLLCGALLCGCAAPAAPGETTSVGTESTVTTAAPITTAALPELTKLPDEVTLVYHANGGALAADATQTTLTQTATTVYHPCPNALPDCGYFRRDGYLLVGYNTAPDGTGRYYAPGWNVVMPESGTLELYCVWQKTSPLSDFRYTSNGKQITLLSYKGSDEVVALPTQVKNFDIVTVSANFLKDNSTVKTLVLPRTVTGLPSNAVVNCPNLTTVFFSDSILSCPDDFIVNCPSYTTLVLSATRLPYRTGTHGGSVCVKWETLITLPSPKLVTVSGSNGSWGVDVSQLEYALALGGHPYHTLVFGYTAATSSTFLLEAVSHFVSAGDVVLHQPEAVAESLGATKLDGTAIDYFEGAYDMFSYVDISHYQKVYSTLTAFFKNRSGSTVTSTYEAYDGNEYISPRGETAWLYSGTTEAAAAGFDRYEASGGAVSFLDAVSYISSYRNELNRCYDLIAAAGAEVLFSFGSVCRSALKSDSREPGAIGQVRYETCVDSILHVTRISQVRDYVFDRTYFYNSGWHLNVEGKAIRTDRLADDLLSHFREE